MPLPTDRNKIDVIIGRPGIYSIQRAFLSMAGEVVWAEIAQADDIDNAEWIVNSLNVAERIEGYRKKLKAVSTS